ncbi:MAG: hypothetical protein IV090_25685 [Candidatus Sericytochromatia bacterium]|nr:hypothetical protein [Candidatus Sericytochromatia bacterium]
MAGCNTPQPQSSQTSKPLQPTPAATLLSSQTLSQSAAKSFRIQASPYCPEDVYIVGSGDTDDRTIATFNGQEVVNAFFFGYQVPVTPVEGANTVEFVTYNVCPFFQCGGASPTKWDYRVIKNGESIYSETGGHESYPDTGVSHSGSFTFNHSPQPCDECGLDPQLLSDSSSAGGAGFSTQAIQKSAFKTLQVQNPTNAVFNFGFDKNVKQIGQGKDYGFNFSVSDTNLQGKTFSVYFPANTTLDESTFSLELRANTGSTTAVRSQDIVDMADFAEAKKDILDEYFIPVLNVRGYVVKKYPDRLEVVFSQASAFSQINGKSKTQPAADAAVGEVIHHSFSLSNATQSFAWQASAAIGQTGLSPLVSAIEPNKILARQVLSRFKTFHRMYPTESAKNSFLDGFVQALNGQTFQSQVEMGQYISQTLMSQGLDEGIALLTGMYMAASTNPNRLFYSQNTVLNYTMLMVQIDMYNRALEKEHASGFSIQKAPGAIDPGEVSKTTCLEAFRRQLSNEPPPNYVTANDADRSGINYSSGISVKQMDAFVFSCQNKQAAKNAATLFLNQKGNEGAFQNISENDLAAVISSILFDESVRWGPEDVLQDAAGRPEYKIGSKTFMFSIGSTQIIVPFHTKSIQQAQKSLGLPVSVKTEEMAQQIINNPTLAITTVPFILGSQIKGHSLANMNIQLAATRYHTGNGALVPDGRGRQITSPTMLELMRRLNNCPSPCT